MSDQKILCTQELVFTLNINSQKFCGVGFHLILDSQKFSLHQIFLYTSEYLVIACFSCVYCGLQLHQGAVTVRQ